MKKIDDEALKNVDGGSTRICVQRNTFGRRSSSRNHKVFNTSRNSLKKQTKSYRISSSRKRR